MTKNLLLKFLDRLLLILSFLLLFLLIWDVFVSKNLNFLYNLLYTPIWIVFTLEYIIKLYFAKHKFQYIRDNLLSVFIIIFPFLRPLRLLAISRFGLVVIVDQLNDRLPWIKKYRVLEVLLFGVLIILLSSDLILMFEKGPSSNIKTLGDALWFSVSTITTTGYGDVYPKTPAGRIVATFLLIFGITAFEILTATLASVFANTNSKNSFLEEDRKIDELTLKEQQIEDLVKKVLVEEKNLDHKLETKD